MRFSVEFLGCKVSHVDAREIREALLAAGHVEARAGEASDVAVINTCCVTGEAVAKSRKAAARAARAAGRVVLTGCATSLPEDAFAHLPYRVELLPGSASLAAASLAGEARVIGCAQSGTRFDRVRAFVKIQDGCSFGCAFCVIPLVRGASRSRSAEAVLGEVRRRVAQGHREVVLTGINLGCFRDRAAGLDLAALVRAVGGVPGLRRLRLSSIEINHVSARLLAALRETPTAARHLHVPLQSGDDDVLRAMGRRYSTATYLRRLEGLADEFNLTSDVIVGFPTEDERAFERTLRTVRDAGLTRVHVFPYSPRPATGTAGVDPVPAQAKKERGSRLAELSRSLERRRWESKLGGLDLVLVDRPGRGYGGDYTPFLVEARVGELVAVRAERLAEEGIVGLAA
jgi:threonylcarbamoyladenosine tRNA methylthiotransferase MtaB